MANDIVMVVEGIKGETQDNEFPDSIELLSWSWSLQQRGLAPVGTSASRSSSTSSGNRSHNTAAGGTDRTNSVASSDIVINKHTDRSSVVLVQALLKNRKLDLVKIYNRKVSGHHDDEHSHFSYLVMELTDARITNYETSNQSGQILPVETYTINYAKIKYSYTRQNEFGGKDKSVEVEYLIPGAHLSDLDEFRKTTR